MTSEPGVTSEASITSKNLSQVAVLRFAQYPFTALFAVIVPRLMGPDDYGRYAWFVSLVGMASAFLDLGMTEIATRAVPTLQHSRGEAGVRKFFSRMLAFKLALDLSLITAFVVGARWLFHGAVPWLFVWPLAIVLLIGDVGGTAYALLFGLNRLAICSARDPIRRAVGVIIVVVLYLKFGLAGAVASVVLVEAVLTSINIYWTRRYVSLRELRPSWSFTAPLLHYGFLFYLSWGITNLWQRLGNTLIGHMRHDYAQIALFDLSNQIFLTAIGFTMFLITSLAPIFTQLRLQGKESKVDRLVTQDLDVQPDRLRGHTRGMAADRYGCHPDSVLADSTSACIRTSRCCYAGHSPCSSCSLDLPSPWPMPSLFGICSPFV